MNTIPTDLTQIFKYGLFRYGLLFSKENNYPNISAFKFEYLPISLYRTLLLNKIKNATNIQPSKQKGGKPDRVI